MMGKHRKSALAAILVAAALLAVAAPLAASADYAELSISSVWPSASRTFPREVTVFNCDRLIIHEAANLSSHEVLSATRGRTFTAVGMCGNFIEVLLEGGGVGYGYASYLQPGAVSSGIPMTSNGGKYFWPYGFIYNTPTHGYIFMPPYGYAPHKPPKHHHYLP